MQGLKDTAANIAASAVSGMEKTKATVQEKVENMSSHDPEQREMARERKEERITQAELDKQEAKQYRAAASKYAASATGGQGYYTGEATDGYMTSGHDTRTHSATEDTGYPMGAHQMSAMPGQRTGQPYGGQVEEGMVSTYPGGLSGDSTTGHNTRAGGTAFRTGTDHSTRYTTETDGTGELYGGQEEEGVMNTYRGGLPGDSTSGRNTRAGDTAFRTGTDHGTRYTTETGGTRQSYGGQEEEGVVSTYPGGLPGDSTTGHNTRAGGTAFRTGTDGTGEPYGGQEEEGVMSTYRGGLPGDSTSGRNTRAGDTAFRTETDGQGYTTRIDGTEQPYGGQEEDMVSTYSGELQDDNTTGHNTRAGGTGYTTETDGTGYITGTGTGSNAPDWQL